MPEKQPPLGSATTHQELSLRQTQILSQQDRIDANQHRIEKQIEQTLINSSSIIAEQERIKDKQSHLDRIVRTQHRILENLEMSSISCEELGRRAAAQTTTILSYQQIIVSNQEKLDRLLVSQANILLNQEQKVIPNTERIVANDLTMLAGLQKLINEQ
jgi:hypothetical protein